MTIQKRSIDLTGRVFNRWTVMEYVGVLGKSRIWRCKCQCGKVKLVASRDLSKGRSKSCGCFALEERSKNGKRARTHGMTSTPEYSTWSSMITRCKNKNSAAWKDYGGRGITVCERWKSFDNFIDDMGSRPSDKHTLDRIDNDLGYSPENVRWATREEQSNNRRNTRRVVLNGEAVPLRRAARALGVNVNTASARFNRGVPIK